MWGLQYDWFGHRGVIELVERFERRTRRVRRIGDDFGARRLFGNEICDAVGVWGLAAVRTAAGDQSVSGFGSDMGLVPVPFAGPGLVTVLASGSTVDMVRSLATPPSYPPSSFPIRVRFHVLARDHSQQT